MNERHNEQVSAYIAAASEPIRSILERVRQTLLEAVPDAVEDLKYGMPTLRLNGNLVHFAANKAHLGYYPSPEGITAFQSELQGYVTSKGAIQFPYDKPIPYDLIARIAIARATVQRGWKKK